MRSLTDQVVEELTRIQSPQYPLYQSILCHAVASAPPVFADRRFGQRYDELACDADWFANSLVANACLEGHGARQIWAFADKIGHAGYANCIRRHAIDESRHSSLFIAALRMTFPGALESQTRQTRERIHAMQPFLDTTAPPATPVDTFNQLDERCAINELVQVHITEIRALILQYRVRDALQRHAPADKQPALLRMSDRLIADEARHIQYSAAIFEAHANEGPSHHDWLYDRFEQGLLTFNQVTLEELDRESISL
jgi:hypothetical protein